MEAKPTKQPTYLDQLLTILSVINGGIWTTTPASDGSSHVSQSTVKNQKNFGILVLSKLIIFHFEKLKSLSWFQQGRKLDYQQKILVPSS